MWDMYVCGVCVRVRYSDIVCAWCMYLYVEPMGVWYECVICVWAECVYTWDVYVHLFAGEVCVCVVRVTWRCARRCVWMWCIGMYNLHGMCAYVCGTFVCSVCTPVIWDMSVRCAM